MGLDRFSNGRFLTGYLSNIFGFFIFNMQERKHVGIVYIFYFYATTVNIPWACYTMKIIHMGLKDAIIFLFSYYLGLLHFENYSHGA